MPQLGIASGRYDRPDEDFARGLDALADHGLEVVVTTECAGRDVEGLAPRGWDVAHRRGSDRGRGECAVLTRASRVRVAGSASVRLTKGHPRAGGRFTHDSYATRVRLWHMPSGYRPTVVAVHMPAHVETLMRRRLSGRRLGRLGVVRLLTTAPRQVRLYMEALTALLPLADADTAIGGDWNLDARRGWVRLLMRAYFPHHRIVACSTGTHGERVIDWWLVPRRWDASHPRIHASGSYSDHDWTWITARWRGLTTVTR